LTKEITILPVKSSFDLELPITSGRGTQLTLFENLDLPLAWIREIMEKFRKERDEKG